MSKGIAELPVQLLSFPASPPALAQRTEETVIGRFYTLISSYR